MNNLVFWNIDAMGWFEPLRKLPENSPLFLRNELCIIRPGLENAINEMHKMGYLVIAATSGTGNYMVDCLWHIKMETLPYIANIKENETYSNYLPFIKNYHKNIAIVGQRPRQQPNSSYGLFIYEPKPCGRDARIHCQILKKLGESGRKNIHAGFENLFYSNHRDIRRLDSSRQLIYEADFYGSKLDLQKEIFIQTVIVDGPCAIEPKLKKLNK